MNPTPRIYLASKSPRRRDLLRQIGVNFDVLIFRSGERGEDADVDETPIPGEAVERYVERLALAKAQAGMRRVLWRKMLARPVLAADTTLEHDGEIIGKPRVPVGAHTTPTRPAGRTDIPTGVDDTVVVLDDDVLYSGRTIAAAFDAE